MLSYEYWTLTCTICSDYIPVYYTLQKTFAVGVYYSNWSRQAHFTRTDTFGLLAATEALNCGTITMCCWLTNNGRGFLRYRKPTRAEPAPCASMYSTKWRWTNATLAER